LKHSFTARAAASIVLKFTPLEFETDKEF